MGTEFYNRSKELEQFDNSKLGVKGLVDSGITTLPRFFIHPPDTLSELLPKAAKNSEPEIIPVIDLSGTDSDLLRPMIVEKIARASRELGFFQVVNHGVGAEVSERVLGAIRGFHEQPAEIKATLYHRDLNQGVLFLSNFDLYYSKAASWRDTLRVKLGPNQLEADEIPEICRNEIVEWNQHMTQLGELLMGLLCEGLGLETNRLKEMSFVEGRIMAGQYYPYCPQHNLTIGATPHTDFGLMTILIQDHIGGLQVKYGDDWVDVKPYPGALVINIGDILQILSNDEYKSVEHRVLANSSREARVSIAIFFETSKKDGLYGPFPELISPEKPACFQQFEYTEYVSRFFSKELDGKSLINYYRLPEKQELTSDQ